MNDWSARENRIVEYILRTQPDIIVFQEVTFLPEVSPVTQVNLLNFRLRFPYKHSVISRLQTSPMYSEYREGLAILSMHPIIESETLVLKQHPNDHLQRIVQSITFQYEDTQLLLANLHFAENEDHAVLHLQETLDIFTKQHKTPILVGDFNIHNLKDYTDIWGDQYQDPYRTPYISFPSQNKCIDYALLPNQGFELDSTSVSPDGLSDHRALCIKIRLAG